MNSGNHGVNDVRFLLPFSTVAAAAVPSWGSECLCNVSRYVSVKENAGVFILSSADGPAFNVLWPLGPCQHGGASRITAQPPNHPERHPECVLVWGKKKKKDASCGHAPTYICFHFLIISTCVPASLMDAGKYKLGVAAEALKSSAYIKKARRAPDSLLVTVCVSTNTGRSV